MDGIKSNRAYVADLLQRNQIICLQEHWLYRFEASTLFSLFPDCEGVIKCFDDHDPMPLRVRPRGNAGVATLWNKSVSQCITELPDGSERVLAIRINTSSSPIILLNTYMPTIGTLSGDSYSGVLDEIYEIISKYSSTHKVIWAGDMNASMVRRTKNSNDRLFIDFCNDNNLHIHELTPNKATYYHHGGKASSQIDYLVTLKSHSTDIEKVSIDTRHPVNVGPHDAILATTSYDFQEPVPQENQDSEKACPQPRTNWKKVDRMKYQEITENRLACLENTISPEMHTDILLNRLNQILVSSSKESQPPPVKTKKAKRERRSKWSSHLKPFVQASKHAYWKWKKAGRSRDEECPTFKTMKRAKLLLRQAQRKLAASERINLYEQIMEAKAYDMQTFYKLVENQRKTPQSTKSIEFPCYVTGDSEAEKWAVYFANLSTPQDLPEYDKEHKTAMCFRRLLISSLPSETPINSITETQVSAYIASLHNNKAPDMNGVTSEHLKFASNRLVTVLTELINRILRERKLPDDLKSGIATPIPKKSLNQTDPDKFRRITVTSLLGKILEKHMIFLSKEALDKAQSPLQFGFTKGVPCNTASLLLTETMAHYKDLKMPLYLTFMDASKAFDVVDHDSALNHLYNQGIKGDLWLLFNDLYTNITSYIKWQGTRSTAFKEEQGIRQGAVSSTDIFKARANPVLKRLENLPHSAQIGSIGLGALMVADDLVLAAETPAGAQSLVFEAETDASREHFSFSKTKTKSVVVSSGKSTPSEPNTLLNATKLEISAAETHLGIARSCDGSNSITVKNRIKLARRTSYSLLGAGLHGLNGVGPEVGKHLWTIYVQPRLLYGLECITLTQRDINEIENYFRSTIRTIQHLPKSTAISAIYLLLGIPPIEAQIHINILTFLQNILQRKSSVEYSVLERQLAFKDASSSSWIWYVQKLLKKYGLPSAFSLLCSTPTKGQWKKMVKSAILSAWEKTLKEEARQKKTLEFLNKDVCCLSLPHPVWRLGGADTLTVVKATTKVKLLVQRYPLYSSRTSGVNYGKGCPLCGLEEETMTHFLVLCPTLAPTRKPYTDKLCCILEEACLPRPLEETDLVQYILDPSYFCPMNTPAYLLGKLEAVTRDLCFALHQKRSTTLGFPSSYRKPMQQNGAASLLRVQCK